MQMLALLISGFVWTLIALLYVRRMRPGCPKPGIYKRKEESLIVVCVY